MAAALPDFGRWGHGGKTDPKSQPRVWPAWSPDGKSIAFNDYPVPGQPDVGIKILDLATRTVTIMPGSEGYMMPTWSPDWKHMVASSPGRRMLYSADSQTWSELATLRGNWIWSNDSRFVSIDVLRSDQTVESGLYRVSIADKAVSRIGALTGIDFTRTSADASPSITLDDGLVMMSDTSVFQIYLLKWN